jgi:hypothetical protein
MTARERKAERDPLITHCEHCGNPGLGLSICQHCGEFISMTVAIRQAYRNGFLDGERNARKPGKRR